VESNGPPPKDPIDELLEQAVQEQDRQKFAELLREVNRRLAEQRAGPKNTCDCSTKKGAA
jgi:hypothetical protein